MSSTLIATINTGNKRYIPRWSEDELLDIKGAMWTCRANVNYGPRPDTDTNCFSLNNLIGYSVPDQEKIINAYLERDYTHYALGPIPRGTGISYYGLFPDPIDCLKNPTPFLDMIEKLWKLGLCPIYFAKPDNWTIDDLDREGYTALYKTRRFQDLVKLIVPNGWEPSMDTSNSDWVKHLQWGKDTFPNAYHFIHMFGDFDAPGNNDDLTPNQPNFIGAPECWNRVAPYLHGWLVQNNGYSLSANSSRNQNDPPTPEFIKNFTFQFSDERGSLMDRFKNAYAGWPTLSEFGANTPIRVYAGEYAAYIDFWMDAPEKYSIMLGDKALSAGADGYLDGGSL